jgi:hypothetical protein
MKRKSEQKLYDIVANTFNQDDDPVHHTDTFLCGFDVAESMGVTLNDLGHLLKHKRAAAISILARLGTKAPRGLIPGAPAFELLALLREVGR